MTICSATTFSHFRTFAKIGKGGMGVVYRAEIVGLFAAIQKGLLGFPEMQISGNGSFGSSLRWYQDRATDQHA